MTDVDAIVRSHPRCVWLDGERPLLAWCEDDDPSLTYDAGRREVTRHQGRRREIVGDDVFAVLEAELAAGAPSDRWFGHLGYACRPDLPARPDPHQPDAIWMRPSHVVELPSRPTRPPEGATSGPVGRTTPPDWYVAAFDRVQEQLRAGNTYEVNLTHRLELAGDAPLDAYRRLRALNPAPYAALVQHDVAGARGWLLSSSPERFAVVSPDGGGRLVETRPIKGTTPRDADPVEDERQRTRLVSEPGFRAENLMIVDLLRNDLAQVCEVGSVRVPDLMGVESYASVHQLVSTVTGRLRDDVSTVAAVRALFPPGSMTGAPKLRTMAVIDAVEATPRGAYAGVHGWIGADGAADLGVVIRSLATNGDGRYRVGTGGGVTVWTTAEREWAEASWKAHRVTASLSPSSP